MRFYYAIALTLSAFSVSAQDTPLPPFCQLWAINTRNNQLIGCATFDGNFTSNTNYCSSFRSTFGRGPPEYAELTSVGTSNYCSGQGTLRCPSQDGSFGLFTNRSGYLASEGPIGTGFSTFSLTNPGNNQYGQPIGDPLYFGLSGSHHIKLEVLLASD